MMKSFRNSILSLFLAAAVAGISACEGERGPAGEAGPTGAVGVAGPKGAAGDPGKSSDEIPSAYEFLKTWGKSDGTAACNDPIFDKKRKAPFPGPATLTKHTVKVPERNPSVAYDNPLVDTPAENESACSNKVFADTITGTATPSESKPFILTPTHGGSADRKKVTAMGTTPVLGNPTFTSTDFEFYGGTFSVDLKADAAAAQGIDRLAVRCDAGKRPVDVTGGRRITGEYRIVFGNGTEYLLRRDSADGLLKRVPNSGSGATRKRYNLFKTALQFCFRLDSVPGTVKCYIREDAETRNPKTEQVVLSSTGGEGPLIIAEHIAFYKDGKFVRTEPMPVNNFLRGKPPGDPSTYVPGFPLGNYAPGNPDSASKICNLFDKGVNPCGDGKVPNRHGTCVTG